MTVAIIEGSGLDVPSILPVMDAAFDPAFGEAWTAAQCLATLSMPGSHLLLARDDSGICGFALSRWVSAEEELLLIGVSPQNRRMGTGLALINSLKETAKRQGRETIFLEVREDNPARSFYDMMGFVAVGRRTGYYNGKDGSRRDAITMAFKL